MTRRRPIRPLAAALTLALIAHGLLVAMDDVAGLASGIARLLDDAALAAELRQSLAGVLHAIGSNVGAEAQLRRVLEQRQALAADSPERLSTELALAGVLVTLGRPDEAQRLYTRVHAATAARPMSDPQRPHGPVRAPRGTAPRCAPARAPRRGAAVRALERFARCRTRPGGLSVQHHQSCRSPDRRSRACITRRDQFP